MKVALGRIICDEAMLAESYYHVARRTRRDGYRALCDVGLRAPLQGVWAAEIGIEEAARRLRGASPACFKCGPALEELRDPVTRLGEVAGSS